VGIGRKTFLVYNDSRIYKLLFMPCPYPRFCFLFITSIARKACNILLMLDIELK